MQNIGKLWAGRLYGTNTGNLFAEFSQDGEHIDGVIRIMDTLFGLTLYSVRGTFSSGKLHLSGTPQEVNPNIEAGEVIVDALLTQEGRIRGTWKSSIGTGGTFELSPHDLPIPDQRSLGATLPEQLYTTRRSIGAVRLSKEDIQDIAELMRRDFLTGRIVVSYRMGDREVSKYLEDFNEEAPRSGDLRYIKMTIQEPEAHGLNKMAMVELSASGENVVMTQSIRESWVIGCAEKLVQRLTENQRNTITSYRKYGLYFNTVIFALMLVFIPEITNLNSRLGFVLFVLVLLAGLFLLHQKAIPNTLISLKKPKSNFWSKFGPATLSWVSGIAAAVIASIIFHYLTSP